jgi:hypothetical protein
MRMATATVLRFGFGSKKKLKQSEKAWKDADKARGCGAWP